MVSAFQARDSCRLLTSSTILLGLTLQSSVATSSGNSLTPSHTETTTWLQMSLHQVWPSHSVASSRHVSRFNESQKRVSSRQKIVFGYQRSDMRNLQHQWRSCCQRRHWSCSQRHVTNPRFYSPRSPSCWRLKLDRSSEAPRWWSLWHHGHNSSAC